MENRIELWVFPTGNVAVYRGNAFIPTEQLTEKERLFVLDRVCDELKGKIDLEVEIKKYTENLYNETFGNGQGTLDEFDWEDIATVIEETARHFAQRGAEHAKKDEIPVPADLEEAAKEYAKTTFKKPYSDNPDEEVTIVEPDKYAGFISGAKWQKEQMMKEARNHFVHNVLSGNDMKKMIEIYNDEVGCKPGNVVRAIIFKKEDEK